MSSTEPTNKEYTFTVNYSEREITCHATKQGNHVSLHMDNSMNAELELQPDGTLKQLSGDNIPDSSLQFIAKHIIEHDQ